MYEVHRASSSQQIRNAGTQTRKESDPLGNLI